LEWGNLGNLMVKEEMANHNVMKKKGRPDKFEKGLARLKYKWKNWIFQ